MRVETSGDAAVMQAAERIAAQVFGGRLKPLPAIVVELLGALDDDGAANADLATRIAHDPRLGAQVLRVVNSPFYGLPRRVADLGEALMVLGVETVRSIVVGACICNQLGEGAAAGFDTRELLLHSFACAVAARRLAGRLDIESGEAFTASLLHDIGKLALHAVDAAAYARLPTASGADGAGRLEAERASFGADHALVGAVLVRLWRLPASIEQAVGLHHRTADVAGVALTDLVAVVDVLVHTRRSKLALDDERWHAVAPALARLGVSTAECLAEAPAIDAELVRLQGLLL